MLAELAKDVREGRVSAVELVTEALERIERRDADVNSVTAVWPEDALEQARALDGRGATGPLAGLPLLVKDSTDVAGRVTNFGSRTMVDRPPAERSEASVERMVAAGAIPIGRTNIPEFAFQGYTDNDVFGPTRNPWGLEWSPGGSSGGSGAALAAGLAPVATGSDGGGSIRTPAGFCGLVGLKPTNGLIGRRPIPSWLETSTQGPFGTSVEDAKLLLRVMLGPAEGDPTAAPSWTYRGGMPSRVLAIPRSRALGPLPTEVDERFREALRAIEADLGLPVEEISLEQLLPSIHEDDQVGGDDWFVTIAVEELAWLGRAWVEEHLSAFSDAFRSAMEDALGYSVDQYLQARLRRFRYAADVDRLLGDDVVLVCPTHGLEGWLADGTVPGSGRPPGAEGYNLGEFNLSGHPAVSVPAGMASIGIPFGLQIVGPRYRDDLVLELAAAWEQARPWPLAAPGYEPFGVG
jgi:Asp-tRNA(Asn)/Glu-tRNA(Gln) amidotransferase A subunit family amidase